MVEEWKIVPEDIRAVPLPLVTPSWGPTGMHTSSGVKM